MMAVEVEGWGGGGWGLFFLGLGEVSSLQRAVMQIETRRQPEKSLESQTLEGWEEEEEKGQQQQQKDNKKYQRRFASAQSLP